MADSVCSSLSYLDLDDPFNTVAKPSIPRATSNRTAGLLDTSQNLDLLDGIPSFGNALTCEDGRYDASKDRDSPGLNNFTDTPYGRDFLRLNAPYRQSAQIELPNKLFERTEELLASDVTDDVTVSDEKLKSLVTMAARLLFEHDSLLNSRKKLIDSMEEMQKTEREAAIQLISELDVELVDEESRKLIQELSYALKLDVPLGQNGKYCTKPVAFFAPSINQESSVPNLGRFSPSLFTVPPPDASRPPPGFGFEQSVPNLDISRQMSTTSSDRQSPPHAGHPAIPCLSNSAPTHNYNSPFPSLLDHSAAISSSGPMFNPIPPPAYFNAPPPNGHHFILPGRSHQPPPPVMMQPGMPKVHLGQFTPVFYTGYRRRHSTGYDRRGRGRNWLKK